MPDEVQVLPEVPPGLEIMPGLPTENPALLYLVGLAPGSRRTQGQALRSVASLLSPNSDLRTFPWSKLRYGHLTVLRALLMTRLSPATTNKTLSGVRAVLKKAFLLGQISGDDLQRCQAIEPMRGTRLPRGRMLTQGEVRALFSQCDPSTSRGARNAAMLGVLCGGGLRREECCSLDLEHYDGSALRVRGKGDRERLVPAPVGARKALENWFEHRGQEPGALLHPVLKNGRIRPRRMTTGAVYLALERIAREAGVDEFSPHDLRRTFVSQLLDLGADIVLVQKLVGHSQISTTSKYDRRDEKAKAQAVELIHIPFGAS